MKKISLVKTITILFAVFMLAVCCFTFNLFNSNAQTTLESVGLNLLLPKTKAEYTLLTSPQSIYCGNDYTAIIQNNNELLISENGGEFKKIDYSFTSLKQVKRLNDKYLIVSDFAKLCLIDLENNYQVSLIKYGGESINGNYFDVCGNLLVTAYSNVANVYQLNSDATTSVQSGFSGINADAPICVYDNFIFYVNGSSVYKRQADNLSLEQEFVADIMPYKMVADENTLYYIKENEQKVFAYSLTTNQTKVFTAESDYELGGIITPTDICIKNGNVFISDSTINAVSEFSFNLTNNKLVFTGYAIAKGKTAFNRISDSAIDIESYKNLTAILDENKLTLFYEGENPTFNNFSQTQLNGALGFSLGKEDLLTFTSNNVKLIDLKTNTVKNVNYDFPNILDTCFAFDKYYLLCNEESNICIYEIGEQINLITEETDFYNQTDKVIFNVDCELNIYLTNTVDNKIYKLSYEEEYAKSEVAGITAENVIKLSTDILGQLFALTPEGIIYLYNDNASFIPLTVQSESVDNLTAFSFDYSSNKVNFIFNGEEYIYSTINLPLISVENFSTTEYMVKGTSVDISNLKIYSKNQNFPAFTVEVNEDDTTTFTFKETNFNGGDFVYVCSINVSVGFGSGTQTLYLLTGEFSSGKNENIIIKPKGITENTQTQESEIDKTYIATNVNAYYLPIITFNDSYVLLKDNATLRLNKGKEITVLKEFSFLNKDFYYAQIKINDTTVNAYVPKSFTVETLNGSFLSSTYKLLNAKECEVKDEDNTTVYTLQEGEQIKFYFDVEDKSLIAYNDNGVWKKGFINKTNVIYPQKKAIKTSLIIICISACVLATSLFLLLRKKPED